MRELRNFCYFCGSFVLVGCLVYFSSPVGPHSGRRNAADAATARTHPSGNAAYSKQVFVFCNK